MTHAAHHRDPVDDAALEELDLYIMNSSELYPQRQAIQRNMMRRIENGTYDPLKAPGLFLYLIDNGAKVYSREFGAPGDHVFSPATRDALAQRMAHREYAELMLQQRPARPKDTVHLRPRGWYAGGRGTEEAYEPAGRELAYEPERRPWPRPERAAREDAGPAGALDWKQRDGGWVAQTFGGASYKLVPEGDGFHAYYVHAGHEHDLGEHASLGAAMGAARRHEPSRMAAECPPGAMESGPGGALDWDQVGDRWEAKAPLGGGKYIINPDPNDRSGFETWYLPPSKDEEAPLLGRTRSLGAAMRRAADHADGGRPSIAAEARGGDDWFVHNLSDRQLEVLFDVEKPHRARNGFIQPQMSVVYDRAYETLSKGGYIVWKPVHEDQQNLSEDHYELTDKGRDALSERRAWIRKMGTPITSRSEERVPVLHEESVVVQEAAKEDGKVVGTMRTHRGIGYEILGATRKNKPGFKSYRKYGYRVHLGMGNNASGLVFESRAEARMAAIARIDEHLSHETHMQGAEAAEDFKTVETAESHAYGEGFRFIAPKSKRQYFIYKRRAVGKSGYEQRVVYFRREKWHISGDKKIVSRLRSDALRIKPDAPAASPERVPTATPVAPVVEAAAAVLPVAARAEEGSAFRKGDEVRWSDAMLAKGKEIDPIWYEEHKDERGVVDHVQRSGDVQVYWYDKHGVTATDTTVHPPSRLALVKSAPEGSSYTGPGRRRAARTETETFGPNAERAYQEGLKAGGEMGNRMTTDPGGQEDIRQLNRTHELRNWSRITAHNEAERRDRGRSWQLGFREGLARAIDAWAKHNIERSERYGSIADEGAYESRPAQGHRWDVPLDEKVGGRWVEAPMPRTGEWMSAYLQAPGDHGGYWVQFDPDAPFRWVPEIRETNGRKPPPGPGPTGTRRGHEPKGKPRKMAREDAKRMRLDAFTQAYVEAALWSSTDESNEQGGDPLDKDYGVEDIDKDTLEQMRRDCAKFQEENAKELSAVTRGRYDTSYAGHDFWLTRNGHGAGYWDGDVPEPQATRLTEASKKFGEFNLYVGDDKKIYGSPIKWKGVNEAAECLPCAAGEAQEGRQKKSKGKESPADAKEASMNGACVAIIERSPGCVPTGIRMESPRDVYDFMAPRYAKLGAECFFVLLVSNQGELLGSPIEIARGQPDRVAVDIEQVIAAAITGAAGGARGWLVSHHHPSGQGWARPSQSDKRLTEDIKAAAKIACPSTAFMDHVIVAASGPDGMGSYYSFEEGKVVKIKP